MYSAASDAEEVVSGGGEKEASTHSKQWLPVAGLEVMTA